MHAQRDGREHLGSNSKTETAKSEVVVGVEKVGPSTFNIPRALLTKYASDLDNTLSTAKMVSQKGKGGEALGFKFKSIDEGSVFEKLGFEAGDLIVKVNDQKVATREDAIGMLPGLLYGSTQKYDVHLVRGGQKHTQTFNIIQ